MGTTLDTVLSRRQTQIVTCGRPANPFATGALLLAADALAVAASGWLGAQIWSRVNDAVIAETYLRLWPASIAFLAAYAMLGLYPGVGLSPVEELRRTVIGTTIVYLVASASIFLSKEISFYSRGVFLVCWASTAVAVPLCRAVLRHCCAARSWWGVPVVVVGAGPAGERVARNLQAQPELGLKPVAFLDDDGEAAAVDRGWFRGSHALVAMPGLSRQDLLKVLERMTAVFSHVIVIPDLFGMASLWVSARDLGGVLGLEVRQNLLNPVNRWMKRGLDLAVAAVAGVLAAPLVAAAALWIKWISPGPAFFLQERGGAGERSIRVWKLRTMYPDAAPMLERHLEQHPEDRQQWQQHFKLKQDPRLLPVIGALLRRTSLDEVPQLWNVIRGDMSLVGPRPLPSYHLEEFDQDFRHLRARVLPGLTGLWQVSTRSDGDLEVQQALDSYYIRNWSLWLDLHILARTVRAVLLRQGAY